jgi:two-component system cell cycle response regulator
MSEVCNLGVTNYEELFRSIPVPCIVFDQQCLITDCNRASLRFFEFETNDLIGSPVSSALATEAQREVLNAILSDAIESGSQEHFAWQVTLPSGFQGEMNCSVIPILGSNNAVVGGIIACIDASKQRLYEQQIEDQLLQMNEYSMEIEQNRWDLEQANQQLEGLARTDGLTGLYNHRHFQDTLAREMKLSIRGKIPLSMILLDVDNFKKYNDSFGHPAGDFVLKRISTILREAARETDVVARYGGEEFAVILPNADIEGSLVVAERMRAQIEAAHWPDRPVTASFGVSTISPFKTPPELIKAADESLYAAKAAGRNRVTHITHVATDVAA